MPSFLAPLFLYGALAAAVPVMLHLLKRQPEARVKFAAVHLLRMAPVEHSSRRRLREWLLLALRVTVLLLLSVAFARPFFAEGDAAVGGVTVIAVDTSLSVSSPDRFEEVRALARSRLGEVPAGALVGIVAFADRADVVFEPSADRGLAAAAIDRLTPGFGGTSYRAAMATSAALLPDGPAEKAIIVVTDLQANGWDSGAGVAVPESARVDVADIGEPGPNLAVVAVESAGGDRVRATVLNASAEPQDASVTLLADGRTLASATDRVPAGETITVTLGGAPAGGGVSVAVDDRQGLDGDNVRYLVVGDGARRPVLVVTSGGDLARDAFYATQALRAAGASDAGLAVEGVAAADLSTWEDARLAQYAVVILSSTRGFDRRGRERLARYLDRGGGVLLPIGPDIDADVAADVFGRLLSITLPTAGAGPDPRAADRSLVPSDFRHPVFRPFGRSGATLGSVRFNRVAGIRGDACPVLARFTTGEPALVECGVGTGRTLVLASDLNEGWNDFPRHAGFVAFLREAVAYLGERRTGDRDYLVGRVPPGVPAVPGLVSAPGAADAGRLIAVNVDPREARPERMSPEGFQSALVRVPSGESAGRRGRPHHRECGGGSCRVRIARE
jgi:hypothetical protein